jgi:hypothetical protein
VANKPEDISIFKPLASGGTEKTTRISWDRPGLIRSIFFSNLSCAL